VLPLQVETFPDFQIKDYPELVEVLGLSMQKRVETYNHFQKRWDCHTFDTIRQVETGETLLFRKLSGGIIGPRLQDCPGLDAEIDKLNGTGTTGKKRTRDNIPDPNRLVGSPNGVKSGRISANTWVRDTAKTLDIHLSPKARTENPSKENCSRDLPTSRSSSTTPAISPKKSTSNDNSRELHVDHALPLHSVALGDRPWVGKYLRNGERAWPTSFFAVDIFEGFEGIEQLRTQRRPTIHLDTAFEMVFDLAYHRSTFHKHYKIYKGNTSLVLKYKHAGSPKRSWSEFVAEAAQDVIEVSETEETSMDELSTESSVKESVVEDQTQQHHSEAMLPSRAINQGWPQIIDFEKG